MINFNNIQPSDIRVVIANVFKTKKPILSNFFLPEKDAQYQLWNSEKTILISKEERDFYRLFVISSEINDSIEALRQLKSDKYIINYPTKGDISEWDNFMEKSGYKRIGHYKRLFNTNIKSRKSALNTFAGQDDLIQIMILLQSHFSPYTDYIPNVEQLSTMISNNQIIADYDEEGKLCGILIYTIEGVKCYLNAWVDIGSNGLFLLHKAYNIAYEKGIKVVYFWVNCENANVLRLHEMMGAKYDGLNDYTYKKQ